MSRRETILLSTPAVVVALLIACAAIVGTALLANLASQLMNGAKSKVTQTQSVILAVHALRESLLNAESGQRGFLLTGETEYLQPFDDAATLVRPRFADLESLVKSDGEQRALVARLHPLVEAKLSEMRQAVDVRRTRGLGAAIGVVKTDEGKRQMDAIRDLLARLETLETAQLAAITDSAARTIFLTQATSWIILTLALGATALTAYIMRRRLRALESFITVCAWTKRVKHQGQWLSFEDFLEKRFNLRLTHGISEDAAREELERIEREVT